ncbi:thiamine phosphate synthase [Tumidithrix elongata RA019]|uniref:Thiamine-phosphate synthase n=1 Tax=Tumidithrix elongata BACA0141 TaxID=2716417 RepID=A0AAW9PUS3_9CYAN|nr:thiamine phosphate synthase [Tumidithrix elongata RA019]
MAEQNFSQNNLQTQSQRILCRILDANLDRSREALRVIEEWCRFGLESAELSNRCKQLRQALAIWHVDELRQARNTPADVGTALTHDNEEKRSSLQAVLRANFCRLQEAMRVLEEYGKVYDPQMGEAFKQMRYQVYTLESQILSLDLPTDFSADANEDRRRTRLQKLQDAHLYLVTMPSDHLLETVEEALQGGVKIVQYRQKEEDDGDRVAIAQQLCQICHQYNALFLVNDRVDIALAVGADGVHLGQQDMPVAIARSILGKEFIIGQSTTNPDELQRAIDAKADYVGVGPVHATPTKPGKAAAGFDYVRYAAQTLDPKELPWYAIGGIDADNLAEVVNAGARRVAVVRSLMQVENPALTAQQMLSIVCGQHQSV